MGSKFSKDIRADKDAYYMSVPEVASNHIAEQLTGFKTAVELCSAVGVMAIALSRVIPNVIAVELDPERVEAAKYNAKLYERSNITFIYGDVLDKNLLKGINAEVAVLDPDWSPVGASKKDHTLTPNDMQPNLQTLLQLTRQYITTNIACRVPKEFTHKTLAEFGSHRLEGICIDGKLKFKVAYFLEGIAKNETVEASF